MAEPLSTIERETGSAPGAAVIWLHGLGADAQDFEPAVGALTPQLDIAVRFVFPNAPVRPVTINGGMQMRAWYDVFGFGGAAPQDEAGIRAAIESINTLVQREVERGIPVSRIVIAGFSQGGSVALAAGLRYPESLAGVIGLSTWLPLSAQLAKEASAGNRKVPIFMGHGSADQVVPIELAEQSRAIIEALGYDVEWNSYRMMHSVSPQELSDVRRFLHSVLS